MTLIPLPQLPPEDPVAIVPGLLYVGDRVVLCGREAAGHAELAQALAHDLLAGRQPFAGGDPVRVPYPADLVHVVDPRIGPGGFVGTVSRLRQRATETRTPAVLIVHIAAGTMTPEYVNRYQDVCGQLGDLGAVVVAVTAPLAQDWHYWPDLALEVTRPVFDRIASAMHARAPRRTGTRPRDRWPRAFTPDQLSNV